MSIVSIGTCACLNTPVYRGTDQTGRLTYMGGEFMFLAPQISFEDCKLLEYVLTRFVEIEEDADRKAKIQTLHAKFRDTVYTEEDMRWDEEKLQEASPEL